MSSTGTTIGIAAAVSAVVTAVVGTLLNWGGRVVSWIKASVPPDHQPILHGQWSIASATSSTNRMRVSIAVAPNRSLRRQSLHPDNAIAFVHTNFPGMFPPSPIYSAPVFGVHFEAPGGTTDGMMWINAGGRVDLNWYAATQYHEAADVAVPLLDLLQPIAMMTQAVRGSGYDDVFGRRAPFFRRRFDWHINVSPTLVIQESSISTSWTRLIFPGAEAKRAGVNQLATAPSEGYGSKQLKNWDPKRSTRKLLAVFLRDFLEMNGYHDCDSAIADTLEAFQRDMLPTLNAANDPASAK